MFTCASVVLKSLKSSTIRRTNSESSPIASPPPALPQAHCHLFFAGTTKWRSSTAAISATTGSRTKTKQSATRTRSTSAVTLGRAPLYKETLMPRSILRQLSPPLRTTRPTLNLNPPQVLLPLTSADIVAKSFPTTPHRTGQPAGAMSLMYTSSANATKARSSSGRIISDSTSSTAMRGPVGSGQTC